MKKIEETTTYFCDICKKEITDKLRKKRTLKDKVHCWLFDYQLAKYYHYGNEKVDICNPCYQSFIKWFKYMRG